MKYEWDEDKRASNLVKHGVDFAEVEGFGWKGALTREDRRSDYGEVRFLHLGTEWVQGSMLRDAPYDIELEYVQRMMAGLLFLDAGSVAKKHAMQLGLGSAALTKFCYKKLRMRATAIEINPQVVSACRLLLALVSGSGGIGPSSG